MFAQMKPEDKIDFIQRFLNGDQALSVFDSTKTYVDTIKVSKVGWLDAKSRGKIGVAELCNLLKTIPLNELQNGFLYHDYSNKKNDPASGDFIITIIFKPCQVPFDETLKTEKEFKDTWHELIEEHPEFQGKPQKEEVVP